MQNDNLKYKNICIEVNNLTKKLIDSECKDTKEFPKIQGVYLVYRDKKVIYAGKSKNLHRRINSNHISGAKNGKTSVLRRKINKNKKFNIPFGKEMRVWVQNCEFSFIEIKDDDLCALVERFVILFLRKNWNNLLNS